jgi:hypothetical protein
LSRLRSGGATFAGVPEITINESIDERGDLLRTRLVNEGGGLALRVGEDLLRLPEGALEAVMKHYGKPLAEPVDDRHLVERLELDERSSLVRFRFMPRYDVIARDYLVLYVPDAEPLCELATAVSGALDHLAKRFSAIG